MPYDNQVKRMWYLVYSKPCQECIAHDNLVRQGYETYLPRIQTYKRRAGRYVDIIEPMFPGYLFIHLDLQADNWSPIRSTRGVSMIVRFGHQPAKVPDELITILKSRENMDGLHVLKQPDYRPGDNVRIIDGVMNGYEGIFLAKTSKERVIVLLEIAGKVSRVQISQDQIEPAM